MPRTLMPTPDDAEPDRRPSVGSTYLDVEERALLDFLRGDYGAGMGEPVTLITSTRSEASSRPTKAADEVLSYLPVASYCYAIVQYDPTTARLVRRIVGMFGDVPSAEQYAIENGYQLYDVVPATAVIAKPPPGQ
jgi:hypothetical protein